GQVKGALEAHVTVFGAKESVVDANVSAVSQEVNNAPSHFEGHFSVLGNDIFDQHLTGNLDDHYNLGDHDHMDIPIFETVLVVGFIPVSLEAGIAFDYGYNLKAKFNQPGCDVSNPTIGMSATFEPYAGVNGYISAGVDLLLAAAGIRGDLTLVRVGLPFTASV